jgi:hypothetical protein
MKAGISILVSFESPRLLSMSKFSTILVPRGFLIGCLQGVHPSNPSLRGEGAAGR